jgi:NADH dehydrogenase
VTASRLETEREVNSASSHPGRHRVVIVGGGFGGLLAARLLGHHPDKVDVLLIDRRNHHLFQPLLYQVATGMLSQGQIAPPIRHVLRKYDNVRVDLRSVQGFDLDRHVVTTTELGAETLQTVEIPYDSLIVAAGAGQSYFGHDEFAFYAPGMKTVDDALEVRRRIFGLFEMAEAVTDPVERARTLTVAVVGAGPTGVELAGQFRELATRSLRNEFRRIDPSSVRVVLLDGGKEPLAAFGNQLSKRAADELERIGVELRMASRVVGIDNDGVDIAKADGSQERLEARTVFWAAGVEASPLAKLLAEESGAGTDRAGRIKVLPDLSLPGHPEVFAIGDMTTVNNLPGVAEVAMQGGLHAANSVLRALRGEPSKPFKYRDLGSVATIGRFRAVASVKNVRLSGLPGWLVWFFVHLAFLTGFGNRLSTLARWLRSMVGHGRGEREFSTAHTGGDLSLPEVVRAQVQPVLFPRLQPAGAGQATASPGPERANGGAT